MIIFYNLLNLIDIVGILLRFLGYLVFNHIFVLKMLARLRILCRILGRR